MSLEDETPSSRVDPEPPPAREERSRWPGWIWGIPIAAVLIVGWLALKQFSNSGTVVTVIFPGAQGISAGQTDVEYDGLKVGQVETVKLEKDLVHVKTDIRLFPEMEGHLGPGTMFWISGPRLSDLSSIRSIISGPSIGMQPESGNKQDEYQGLAEPPAVPEKVEGTHYVLHATRLGTVARGSQIYFHDLKVGLIEDATLEADQSFAIAAFVKAPYDKLVHDDTRFWNAGAVQISTQGSGPRVQLQGISALLSGAVDFDTPRTLPAGAVAANGHAFTLYVSKSEADFAPGPQAVSYRAVFGADAGSLTEGAAVNLAGTQVGSVQSAHLEYDPESGTLHELVTFAIQPSRIPLAGGAKWPASGRTEMDALMNRLIAQGLRAQPGSSIPLVGPKDVELAFVKQAAPASLIEGDPPEIPSESGGSGIDGIMASVSGVATKIDNLPLDQIADNIHTITSRLADLSKSPELTHSLESLHQSLANVEKVTATAKIDVPALLAALRKAATDAQGAVSAARNLISSTAGNGPMGMNTAGLNQTLYEVSRAAASIRQLTDYLTLHPSALIRGRQ
ncbi:MAG: MlaD family protein [Acetobacteraceae bacterium]